MGSGPAGTSQPSAWQKIPKRTASHVDVNNTSNNRSKRSRISPKPLYAEASEEEEEDHADVSPTKRRRKIKSETRNGDSSTINNTAREEQIVEKSPKGKASKKPKASKAGEHTDNEATNHPESKPKPRRKTKEEKEAEAMPIAARTGSARVLIGAHVSAAGGVHNSVTNSLHIGGNAFALFQKSQRKWDNPSIKQEHADQFKSLCAHHGYAAGSHVVPHGSYLVNLAQRDAVKATQAYDSFLDDLLRSESLGIKLYNFHPGNTNGEPRSEAIGRIAQRLNAAHKATESVVTLLENMAASPTGNTIGGRFEDLKEVIDLIDDKTRVGVCLDTCHTFAAGYDMRSPDAFGQTMSAFDRIVGFKYLRAVHMNDSKAPLGSHRDLHQNIGCGFLGLRAFHSLVNDKRFAGLPLILETPTDTKGANGKDVEDKSVWAREIKLLESLVDMDTDGDEFKTLEKDLADKGAAERAKHQDQFEKKAEKSSKKPDRRRKRKQSSSEDSDEADG